MHVLYHRSKTKLQKFHTVTIDSSKTYPSKQITEVLHKSQIPQQLHKNNHRCRYVAETVVGSAAATAPPATADPGRRRNPSAAVATPAAAEAASPTTAVNDNFTTTSSIAVVSVRTRQFQEKTAMLTNNDTTTDV
uniref:Uncharacterized protein n=1 Tax=Oryza sativa subsp. japonica TaxID=39947 RepID=Q5KQL8_ORYSJ|nr:hypothetical protein [Oryza sativa Japonica Group]